MADVQETPQRVVLIAVDGSDTAVEALQFYVAHIHQPGNSVLVAHGAEPPPMTISEAGILSATVWDNALEAEQLRMKELEQKFAALMRANKLTGRIKAQLCSRANEFIVELAKKEKCSMIVIGSRGMGLVRRNLLGSVSEYVLHHAHCPVVVCARQHHGQTGDKAKH